MNTATSPKQNSQGPDVAALHDALLKIAILGTARQSLNAEKIGADSARDSLSQLLAQIDFSDRERCVLDAAALLHSYSRAGQMPSADDELPPQPCLAEETPRCNAAASTRLAALLQQSQSPLLAEWLRVAGGYGLRAPEEDLPELLDAGKQNRELRPSVAAVLGSRGRWLAAQNPAWSYAVEVSHEQTQSDEIWHTGTKAERLSFLKYWRDHDASKARELLASTWKDEPSDERARFIETFAIGLSIGDEEFLENALDDKRKEVRESAAQFLALLPESRLVARSFERLKNILTLTTTSKLKKLVGRGAVIEVALPKEFERAMARDGIVEKWYGGAQKGQKASWVQQMVGIVPPSFWEREWKLPAPEIIKAASAGEWAEVLLNGFVSAAIKHKDTVWLEILSAELFRAKNYLYVNAVLQLPAEHQQRFALQHLGNGLLETGHNSGLSSLIDFVADPWGTEFSQRLLDVARDESRKSASPRHWLHYSLKNWASRIAPELYNDAATAWPTDSEHWESWEPVVNEFLGVLQMRRDMLRELRESRQQ